MALMYPLIPGATEQTGIPKSTLYEKIKAGELRIVKVGRRSYVTAEELERFVQNLAGAGSTERDA